MIPIRQTFRNGTGRAEGFESGSYTTEQKKYQFTEKKWTCENESYHFQMHDAPKDPWEECFDVVDKADEELYKGLQAEISGLLLVASLFLAVVTAFSIMSFEWLRADDNQLSAALLGDIVKLLNGTDARGTVPPRDATTLDFSPKDSDIIVNQLWFLSMFMGLSAVVVGTLYLQWISAFRRKELKRKYPEDALALRQLRFEGLMGWGVHHVPGLLFFTVQGAFVLFATGLIYLLWSVNNRVAIPVVIAGGVVALLLIITTVMPLLQSVLGRIIPMTLGIPQCPYKSPLSWVVHRGCVLLSIIVTLPFYRLPGFRVLRHWHMQQVELLTDYTWQIFDDLWRHQRESKAQTFIEPSYSHYRLHGLVSAMEMLLLKPNAVDIIHKCLQDFYGTAAENEVFHRLFGKESSKEQEVLDDYERISSLLDKSDDKGTFNSHIRNLKKDIFSARTFQSFAFRHEKLHRTLLPHRVELYVRIKNSIYALNPTSQAASNVENQTIGASIKCPIRCPRDAETLPPALLDQLLHFADWYLDGHRCEETEVAAIGFVLEAIERLQTVYGTKATDADEPRFVDMDGSGSGSKPHNESVTAGSPVDKGHSAELMDLHKVVLDKLKKYEQRARDEEDIKHQQESKEEKSRSILPHYYSQYRSQDPA